MKGEAALPPLLRPPGRGGASLVAGFARTLNYSSVNEDWRTEARALRVTPRDSVLCVTGSGARPLDLLDAEPGHILAVDVNPAQNALLHLKIAAIRALSFDAYSRFLGLSEATAKERLDVFSRLAVDLPPPISQYWQEHLPCLTSGVLWSGRWERYFRRVGFLARLLRPRVTARLLECQDLESQRRFVEERWNTVLGRSLTRAALSRPLVRLAFGDPAFLASEGIDAGRFVHDRMTDHLRRVLARESFMVSLILTGRLCEADLPPHLTREGVDRIRPRLDSLEIVTADVIDLLRRPKDAGRFDAFSISDLPSFLTRERFEELLHGILESAAPRARFCIRLFLRRPALPDPFPEHLIRDGSLEASLAEDDHAFAYDFLAGFVAAR